MEKAILVSLFLSLIPLACGAIILDYNVTTEYMLYEEIYYEVYSIERFTFTAATPVYDFMIGITAPFVDTPPQKVYLWEDINLNPVNPQIIWSELDVHIPNRMPIVNVLKPNTFAEYMGTAYNNMDIWWVGTNSSTGVTGPIVEFVYIPEPATLLLLGLGGLMLRRKK